MKIPFYIKLIIVFLGFLYPIFIGLLLLLLDGYFHFTLTDKGLKENSPDWIILNYLNTNGLSLKVHHYMGIFLLLVGLYISLLLLGIIRAHPVYSGIYFPILKITLGIVALAILIKREGRVAFLP